MISVRPLCLTDVIARHAELSPEGEAVVCGQRRLNWSQLVGRMHQVGNALKAAGLRPGDKVATLINNSIELLEIMLGTIAAGGVIVPLSVLMARESLAGMVNNSQARFLFAADSTLALIEPIPFVASNSS